MGSRILHICCSQSSDNVLLRVHRRVFGLLTTVRETRNLSGKVGVAEVRNRLARGRDRLCLVDLLRRGGNDAVERRSKGIVTPSRKQIADVDDYRSWL